VLFFLLIPPLEMQKRECAETSVYEIQSPGNHPKERIKPFSVSFIASSFLLTTGLACCLLASWRLARFHV